MTRVVLSVFAVILVFGLKPQPVVADGLVDSDESLESEINQILIDGEYRTACGPIAVFCALTALNIDTTLHDTVVACDWSPGNFTTVAQMTAALGLHSEIRSESATLSPDDLSQLLSEAEAAAILITRKNSEDLNHAVCAVRSQDGHFFVLDYPELTDWVPIEELAEIWDGNALIVTRDHEAWYRSIAVCTGGIAIGLLCLASARTIRQKRNNDIQLRSVDHTT